jgi:hypothetical protein
VTPTRTSRAFSGATVTGADPSGSPGVTASLEKDLCGGGEELTGGMWCVDVGNSATRRVGATSC